MFKEIPRQENGVLYIGDSTLVLHGCSLDALLYYFGYPESFFYLTAYSRFVVFKFRHELGEIVAFFYFRQPDPSIYYEVTDEGLLQDRGNLAELHIELDQSQMTKRVGKVHRRLKNQGFDFVVFSGNVIGRKVSRNMINALSFINPNIIKSPEKSFMYGLYFWLDSRPLLRFILDDMNIKNQMANFKLN